MTRPCHTCKCTMGVHLYTIKVDGKQSRCILFACDTCIEKYRRKHPNIEYHRIVVHGVEL